MGLNIKKKIGMSVLLLGVGGFVVAAHAAELEIVSEDAAPDAVVPAQGSVTTEPAQKPEPILVRADDQAPEFAASAAKNKTKKVKPVSPEVLKGTGAVEATKYTLGPDDVIEIIVRRHPEFSGNYPVNLEGKIQYKFIGDIEIKGMTKVEVKDRITDLLKKYIINPEVEVTIVDYKSKVLYVIGEVGAPGKYYMRTDKISVRDAVVQAGLPLLSAAMRKTELIRPSKEGTPEEIKMDLYALLYEGKLNLDQEMYPGDVLVVPATLFAKIARIISPVAGNAASVDTIATVGSGGYY